MLYASLKAVHLLAVVVWVGGMAFALYCLHPAAKLLEPAQRVPLMHAVLRRFLAVVGIAAAVIFVSGAIMIGVAWSAAARAGIAFNMPLDWYAMVAIFFVMLAVYLHVRLPLFARVGRALEAGTWPVAGAALNAIRWEVAVNLVLGVFVVVLVRLGAAA